MPLKSLSSLSFVAATLFAAAPASAQQTQATSPAATPPAAAPKAPEGWRLQKALALPEWLKLSGSQRTRFEVLDGQFRSAANFDGSDHLFALRTTLRADVKL